MAAMAKDITRTYVRPPAPTSRAQAKDGAGSMVAKAMAEEAKVDGAKDSEAKLKEKGKEVKEKGTKADCMSLI